MIRIFDPVRCGQETGQTTVAKTGQVWKGSGTIPPRLAMDSLTKGLQSFQQVFGTQSELARIVESATSETLLGPDQHLNTKICDAVNANPREGAQDSVRTLRRRLRHTNPKVQLLCLTLADTLVRRCGLEMHLQIASKDFMTDMQALVSGLQTIMVDIKVNRRALLLIQCWGEVFHPFRQDVPHYTELYDSLYAKLPGGC